MFRFDASRPLTGTHPRAAFCFSCLYEKYCLEIRVLETFFLLLLYPLSRCAQLLDAPFLFPNAFIH
ncbi:MAG: hypothetical protein A3C08_03745 [Candidatus Taylorbacteria bacterium RIFCSPHIGHO2_02_FULL_47_18]|uniref:Uncharacterized protein n=1 Tax=Candidatus Taylorbacteria bacterium RIFCSPLOWO2_01_FULL_48_100 TaxID=1802322 RepID=A0A1G2NEM6_9BACT|nr:MAG: hypothetical protein A2670_00695 [Candidatus Taylorbacteria bacterium RIFCSPHIGHO2_01_FULL_48_38]OHA28245.1 MAG: hypothetical protein A3C08_03745 [Candidatus Taylorbacteria bacterium RIFCSPHIGHO2_02_FULL_47_18]OHA34535.1 MAG: hypothetical protein A2938_03205 [Candidatus Taylorbacteria bacterium RIFCSPLOWO2_01_FULL_48_100]OHA40843.1 MAG: hypothetical protein A3J31_03495 [Candidatus Taylorbacteria bacterium RIFCSPLOWO2_02_FULL_48_16]OHA45624.1 MAG: hypothetical protein A3H13_02585 [Candid